jgi:O-antigen/teichoic acid export membrane protein
MDQDTENSKFPTQGLTPESSKSATAPHDRCLSLRANFSWTFVGRVVYAGCQWGMLTALAKLGSPEMVGRFALGLAVTAPIIMFSMLQLRSVQATDARREYEFGHYLALRLGTSTLALLVIAVVTFLSGYRGEVALVIMAMGLAKAVESVSDAYHGLMQQRERMDRIAVALMLKGPLLLMALAITVYFTGSVLWGVAAMSIVYLAILLGYERVIARKLLTGDYSIAIRPFWQWHRLTQLAWLALPLGVVMMLISLNTNIPRYFIERIMGERGLGYFAALAYLQVAGNTVISALGQSASPRLAQYYAAGQRDKFLRLLLRLVGIGALLGLGGVVAALLFGRPILILLYRPDYAQHVDVFVWLMIASGISFVASFLGYGLTATRRFHIFLTPYIVTTCGALLSSALLIPRYGLLGAAWTTIIIALITCISLLVLLYKTPWRRYVEPITR